MVAVIGDVVEIRQRPGRWAVLAPVDNPADPGRRQWRVRGAKQPGRCCAPGATAGDGDLIVIAHPTFTPGQPVYHDHAHNGHALVVADNGATVRIRYQHIRPRNLRRDTGAFTMAPVEVDVDRGDLVADQLEPE